MLPDLLSALDRLRKEEGGDMSRPEAVRLLVKNGLIGAGYLNIPEEA